MKQRIVMIGFICIMLLGLTGCKWVVIDKDKTPETGNKEEDIEVPKYEYELTKEGIIKSEDAKAIIEEISAEVLQAISKKDARTISEHTHPTKGVRFTPYTNVSFEHDLVFTKDDMLNFFDDQEIYTWGFYDGKGDQIKLTPSEYDQEFIYANDYSNAELIGYNEVLSNANIVENQFEVYEQSIVVEYYFSGFNPEFAGIDWRSLRLVFQEYENTWKLVGIINNQWTV